MTEEWQAGAARNRFTAVVDAAVAGQPQFIRRRDGREVVVVSREYFELTRPNLKTYLLAAGYAGDEDDAFDRALRTVRRDGEPMFGERAVDLKE
jgi:prevent-host-death family protein